MSAEVSGRTINSSVDHGFDGAGIETDAFSMEEIRGSLKVKGQGGKQRGEVS
jgi:hypothetical protein